MFGSIILRRTIRTNYTFYRTLASDGNGGPKGDGKDTEQTDKGQSAPELTDKQLKAKEKLSSLLKNLSQKSQSPSPADNSLVSKLDLARPRLRTKEGEVKGRELRQQYQEVDAKMAQAVKSVAEEIGGGPNTESQLLKSLQNISETPPTADVRSVLSSLTVEKSAKRSKTGAILSSSAHSGDREKFDLFGAEPLGIFPTPPSDHKHTPVSTRTWDRLAAHDLETCVAQSPANHWQELVQWTNQGKVWTFPIDNEIGLDEEKSVGFHEHVFLERHLVAWCPKAGPIRNFMELVCVGLSKNPHITVERKKTVINWYRDFFDSHKTILEEVGAYPKTAETHTEEKPLE